MATTRRRAKLLGFPYQEFELLKEDASQDSQRIIGAIELATEVICRELSGLAVAVESTVKEGALDSQSSAPPDNHADTPAMFQ